MYLVEPSPEWPAAYAQAVTQLHSVYPGEIRFHHIGSTAVPGLIAKDCIDILGLVSDLAEVGHARQRFETIGYEARGAHGIEGREYFVRERPKVHLHCFQTGHRDALLHLHFVEVMRAEPALVVELNALKRALQAKYPNDKSRYQAEKQVFYDRIHQRWRP